MDQSSSDQSLEDLVKRARDGDADALEAIVRSIQDRVYGLSMRMLGHPEDAQDATQEILVKVVTHLATFETRSNFTTWVYRVAANHLLNTRQRSRELRSTTFEQLGTLIDAGLASGGDQSATEPERALLIEEVRIDCTQGMLLCLDREQRMAYILSAVFEVSSAEGGAILAITPTAFRQRLARARRQLRDFMEGTCGLVNPDRPCRCSRQLGPGLKTGKIDPARLAFASHPTSGLINDLGQRAAFTRSARAELLSLDRAAAVFRSHPVYRAPDTFVAAVRQLLATPGTQLFES